MNKSPVVTDLPIHIESLNSSPLSSSSPSPKPLTPNTQKYSMINLCYAPSTKPKKPPPINNSFKKLKL